MPRVLKTDHQIKKSTKNNSVSKRQGWKPKNTLARAPLQKQRTIQFCQRFQGDTFSFDLYRTKVVTSLVQTIQKFSEAKILPLRFPNFLLK